MSWLIIGGGLVQATAGPGSVGTLGVTLEVACDSRYCEGFVLAGPALFPVEHAWWVDEAGNVVDNTLREPGVGYFGIPFDSKWVVRKVGSGADSLVDELLLSKKTPKTAIAKPYRR